MIESSSSCVRFSCQADICRLFTTVGGISSAGYNNRLSVTSDCDCILAMLLGSSRNGRLEVNAFSVPSTSGTVSVIRRDAKRKTSGLTAPGSLLNFPNV